MNVCLKWQTSLQLCVLQCARASVDHHAQFRLVHSTPTELNWPATSRLGYTTPSLVVRFGVTTWLAAAKLGRLVLSQFVRCERSHIGIRVFRSSFQFSLGAVNKPLYSIVHVYLSIYRHRWAHNTAVHLSWRSQRLLNCNYWPPDSNIRRRWCSALDRPTVYGGRRASQKALNISNFYRMIISSLLIGLPLSGTARIWRWGDTRGLGNGGPPAGSRGRAPGGWFGHSLPKAHSSY